MPLVNITQVTDRSSVICHLRAVLRVHHHVLETPTLSPTPQITTNHRTAVSGFALLLQLCVPQVGEITWFWGLLPGLLRLHGGLGVHPCETYNSEPRKTYNSEPRKPMCPNPAPKCPLHERLCTLPASTLLTFRSVSGPTASAEPSQPSEPCR